MPIRLTLDPVAYDDGELVLAIIEPLSEDLEDGGGRRRVGPVHEDVDSIRQEFSRGVEEAFVPA